ncbi:hypothetical protein Q666_04090 [Marinobacter sp. ES-1]|nr:hypothetical protein Q666_04090 [Marinobacter sp. ES-1]
MALYNRKTLFQFLILQRAVFDGQRNHFNLSPSLAFKHMHVGRRMIIGVEEEFESIQEK